MCTHGSWEIEQNTEFMKTLYIHIKYKKKNYNPSYNDTNVSSYSLHLQHKTQRTRSKKVEDGEIKNSQITNGFIKL